MSQRSLARRERHALCDLALALGPDAPTLCGDWDAEDLVAHLLVRENRPIGALGISVSALSGLADKAMASESSKREFPEMVERLRDPGMTFYALPGVEQLTNTFEYLVHHEDLRRAQPDWVPRTFSDADEDELWKIDKRSGPLMLRNVDVPVVLRRSDRPKSRVTVRKGDDPVTITGKPSELALVLFGRTELSGVEFDGPAESVRTFRAADKGF